MQQARGELGAALRTYREGLRFATEGGRLSTYHAAEAHVGIAQVLYERNALAEALRHVTEGVELSGQLSRWDRWWNPAVENQATDRAFRIGQKRNVQVRKFICTGTLEEKIDKMIEEKKALADLVITDGERWLTELSTDSLREIFALSEGAVGE